MVATSRQSAPPQALQGVLKGYLLLLILLFLIQSKRFDVSATVIELNDSNFDTLTQDGQANGRWFIQFYTDWCKRCKKLKPMWDALATNFEENRQQQPVSIHVASVNAQTHKSLGRRFNVTSFPTFVLLADTQMYIFNATSQNRTLEILKAFAMGGYAKEENRVTAQPIPPPLGPLQLLLEQLTDSETFLDMKNIVEMRKNAAISLVLLGLSTGVLTGLLTF